MSWSCFTEIIDIVSKIATTIFAGLGTWIAYQTLLRTPVQETEPAGAEAKGKETAIPSELLVFSTSTQTTKLKVTDMGLECYLDDRRPGKQSGHQWTLTKDQAKEILSSGDFRIYPGYKLYSGVFSIGHRKNWLYSKKLFPEPGILEAGLEKILKRASM
ncbi:MAG: hypothetical protein OEZ10_13545 [Gammaproteobacteria bacterium]|nr:hypothetical protein [Gammaproteobacteria bacterium]